MFCPYKDELTSYERDMLRKAIYSADIIITDGDKAVDLSYMPEKRGDYAPVTMGYVREEKNQGILAALAEEKYIVHDAPLTRYLHSFDNPYWEIPTDLYQIMAKLYAKYYNEFKPERNLIRIEEWMKNRHGNSKNTRL